MRRVLLLFVATLWSATLCGQTPRIEELSGDSLYMRLLTLDSQYGADADSISRSIAENREIFLSGGEEAFEAQSMIMMLEQALFNLRTRRTATTEQIEQIEQEWIANNGSSQSDDEASQDVKRVDNTSIYPTEIVGHISQSSIVGRTLSAEDLSSLKAADGIEVEASRLYNRYIDNYLRAGELLQLYNQTEQQSEALEYELEFGDLLTERDSLADALEPLWEVIYDEKLFIYSLLLETLNNNEVLDDGLKSMRKAEVKVSSVRSMAANPSVVDYMHKKLALVEFESQIAERFNLPRAADSLMDVAQQLAVHRSSDEMPELALTERIFIPYESLSFSSNNSSSSIPLAERYERGRIYRIQFGNYKAAQKSTLFKGATPLSYEIVDGMYTYYGGAYATYIEAEQAQAQSKAQGFNRPEMVVWSDGERRNLFRDPLAASKGYNVVIDGVSTLAAQTSSIVDLLGGGAKLVRISTNKYVISPLKNQLVAEDLVTAIEGLNREATISITEVQ